MDVDSGAQGAYFNLLTNTGHFFISVKISFSVVLSVGIKTFMEEANISKDRRCFRHGEEVGFPAMTT